MATKPTDGGQAFPSDCPALGEYTKGMSLRDWFAGQALAGLCATGEPSHVNGVKVPLDKAAYRIADALLAAREAK